MKGADSLATRAMGMRARLAADSAPIRSTQASSRFRAATIIASLRARSAAAFSGPPTKMSVATIATIAARVQIILHFVY
ncbi:hypothetical protein C8258_11315 [Nocardia sp. MDA0666]|nr:hypothetical protein C8258_11315 [Nocardia sp. MDA0666]